MRAPGTRPDRFTILEHLALDEAGVRRAVAGVPRCLRSLSCARPPSRPSIFERNSGEHWAGRLYMRRLSPYLTRLLLPHADHANGVTWLMILAGARGGRAC